MSSWASSSLTLFRPRDFLLVLALGLVLAVVQAVLAARLGWPGFGPQWPLTLAVYLALRTELETAVAGAFLLGLIFDGVGGGFWGLKAFVFVLLIWLFHPFRARLNFFSPLTLIPLIFILTLGGELFVATPIMAIMGWPGEGFNPVPAFFVSAAGTALTAPPVFALLNFLTRPKDIHE